MKKVERAPTYYYLLLEVIGVPIIHLRSGPLGRGGVPGFINLH